MLFKKKNMRKPASTISIESFCKTHYDSIADIILSAEKQFRSDVTEEYYSSLFFLTLMEYCITRTDIVIQKTYNMQTAITVVNYMAKEMDTDQARICLDKLEPSEEVSTFMKAYKFHVVSVLTGEFLSPNGPLFEIAENIRDNTLKGAEGFLDGLYFFIDLLEHLTSVIDKSCTYYKFV